MNARYTRDRLADDFSNVLSEAEDLLQRAGRESGDKARDLRSQVEASLLSAKHKLGELEDEAIDRAKAAARYTDDYVHDHPWQSMGFAVAVAAALGVAIGVLMQRR